MAVIGLPMLLVAVLFKDVQALMTYGSPSAGYLLEFIIPVYLLYSLRNIAEEKGIKPGKLNRSFVEGKTGLISVLGAVGCVGALIVYGMFNNVSKQCVAE